MISSLVGATVVSGLIRPALDSIHVVKMFALTVAVPGGRVWVAVAVSGTLDRTLPLAFEAVSVSGMVNSSSKGGQRSSLT